MKLEEYLRFTLNVYMRKRNESTCIVVSDIRSRKVVNNILLNNHDTIPDWVGLNIVKKTLTTIQFTNDNSISILVMPAYLKGRPFDSLGYFDMTGKTMPPEDINFFTNGKTPTVLTL